jgi:SNF2 family DNA or RNA helicase
MLRHPNVALGADLVIVDEAHYCKTPTAQRTIAALGVAQASPRSWLLSGTPMPNHPGELYAPIAALWPGVPRKLGLKNHEEWFDYFCLWSPTKYGKRVYGVKNGAELRPYLNRLMLRRKEQDVALDLPPLRVTLHHLPNNGKLDWITGEETATQRRLLGDYKAPLIAALVAEELEAGAYQKIVLGAYHLDTMAYLREALAKFRPVGFDGSTPLDKRQAAIDAFTNDPGHRIFLVQQTSGGVAINLQAASEIILVEPDWTPDVNAQFIKRIHRIGQDEPCRARLFTVSGTLDDAVMSGLAVKIRMQVELGLK